MRMKTQRSMLSWSVDDATSLEKKTGLTMASLADLTPRELESVRLVLMGNNNRAIAKGLFIIEKTVEFHLNNFYTKLGVRTLLLEGVWEQGNRTCPAPPSIDYGSR